ncbi:MAG: outer membrane lipoprotein-sorting protein [Bacteroidota bacterium]
MRHKFISLALCVVMLLAIKIASAQMEQSIERRKDTPTAEEILHQSDLSRNGWESYTVITSIKNYVDEELKDEGSFEVSMKGADKTLVKFLNADVKGQYLLMLDDAMWIYMPNTRKPIRITPLQRLMGNASNGDVARTRYADDYAATLKREQVIDGVSCYMLELMAKREGATYQRIEYWVAKENLWPKKAEIYLTSGKHYKTIIYDKYRLISDRVLLSQMTILDALREGRTTIMTFTGYTQRDIPAKYFNKDYLEKLR